MNVEFCKSLRKRLCRSHFFKEVVDRRRNQKKTLYSNVFFVKINTSFRFFVVVLNHWLNLMVHYLSGEL